MAWRPAKDLDNLNRSLIQMEQALLSVYRRERLLAELLDGSIWPSLLQVIDENPRQAALMSRIKSGHAMTPRHAINVLCLARAWAIHAHRLGDTLADFSLAALLHDLGHWRPDTLVYVFHYFSHEQARELRNHPQLPEEEAALLPESTRQWIEQHHEQPDGKGYPKGINNPHPLAQALRIVDIYDGLTTPRRFRPAYTPFRAMQLMSRWAGFKFDRRLFRSFEQFWGRYPAGTYLHLTNGAIAVSLPPKSGEQTGLVLTNTDGDPIDNGPMMTLTDDTVEREAFSTHGLNLPDAWKNVRPDLLALPRYYPT